MDTIYIRTVYTLAPQVFGNSLSEERLLAFVGQLVVLGTVGPSLRGVYFGWESNSFFEHYVLDVVRVFDLPYWITPSRAGARRWGAGRPPGRPDE